MKVGLMSDTHGNISRTARAVRMLLSEHVDAVIHCGDIGAEGILDYFAAHFGGQDIPVYAVRGNVDLFWENIQRYPSSTGVIMLPRVGELELGGWRMAVVHGDDARALKEALTSGKYDFLFTGHTHRQDDRVVGTTRVINPGALHNTSNPSYAVLDTDAKRPQDAVCTFRDITTAG
jgi:uncharacterized protein